jgi:hypothetical protein
MGSCCPAHGRIRVAQAASLRVFEEAALRAGSPQYLWLFFLFRFGWGLLGSFGFGFSGAAADFTSARITTSCTKAYR